MPIAWQMQPGLAATSTCMFHASLPPLRVLVTTRSLQTGPDKGYPVGGVAHPLRSDDAHLYPARLGVNTICHLIVGHHGGPLRVLGLPGCTAPAHAAAEGGAGGRGLRRRGATGGGQPPGGPGSHAGLGAPEGGHAGHGGGRRRASGIA